MATKVHTTTSCRMPTMCREFSLAILVIVILFSAYTTEAMINPETITKCLPREYRFNATKTFELKGQKLSCWDIVEVYSCWGRCDSFEYGDHKIPYKISYHPVCTYTGKTPRLVRLRNCHPDFPDPSYEVFDATGCSCKLCDSANTSCENLNG